MSKVDWQRVFLERKPKELLEESRLALNTGLAAIGATGGLVPMQGFALID